MEFQIPCAVVGRLARVIERMTYGGNEWFNSIRIESGIAIASNRTILAAEIIGGPGGTVHIVNDPALIAQCRREAAFDSMLSISVNEALRFATCKTTLGYIHTGNCAVWSNAENLLADWRKHIPTTPVKKPKGGMVWVAENINALAASSPSGRLIFEEVIDATRPTIVRDALDSKWFGMFIPDLEGKDYVPATIPDWLK